MAWQRLFMKLRDERSWPLLKNINWQPKTIPRLGHQNPEPHSKDTQTRMLQRMEQTFLRGAFCCSAFWASVPVRGVKKSNCGRALLARGSMLNRRPRIYLSIIIMLIRGKDSNYSSWLHICKMMMHSKDVQDAGCKMLKCVNMNPLNNVHRG